MKNQRWIAALFVCLTIALFANNSPTFAQSKVAIVDIGMVFKSHPNFTNQLEALKQEADQFQTEALQKQQALVQRAEVLKQYVPGSEDYKSADTQLAQQAAAMEVEQREKMRVLMQREAQLHFTTYAEVRKLVSSYCESSGIQLVLRYNSQAMDPKVPASIMQKVNGSVIFHNQNNDITQTIIAQIGRMNGTANASSAQPRQ